MFDIVTFYRFAEPTRPGELRARLLRICRQRHLLGTVLIAREGINATLCGARENLREMLEWLEQQPGLARLEPRWSRAGMAPFQRLVVKLKREIVSFSEPGVDAGRFSGVHVAPEQWDALLARDEVRLIDTRNDYEVDLGSFAGAENPHTGTFREFADYVTGALDPARDRHVAMYCTGGIRCEKASAWMRQQGFENVYQLAGGIINYLQRIPAAHSSWRGECFVFDDRVCLDHELRPTARPICRACRMPLGAGDIASPRYRPGICCPNCYQRLTPQREAGLKERARQQAPGRREA